MSGWMGGWMDVWMDERIYGWMDGQIDQYLFMYMSMYKFGRPHHEFTVAHGQGEVPKVADVFRLLTCCNSAKLQDDIPK